MISISKSTQNWLKDTDSAISQYQVKRLFDDKVVNSDNLLKDPFIKENLSILKTWKTTVLKNHNQAKQPLHRLCMLADLGLKYQMPGVKPVIDIILSTFNDASIPEVLMFIPKNFRGKGVESFDWVICDYPTTIYALLKMGVNTDTTEKSIHQLEHICRDAGYLCTSSVEGFRGPGPKDSICPYANLISAKALAQHPDLINSPAAALAIEAILAHWRYRRTKKYYLFGMGTDFLKLKLPFIWYNILHVLEAISYFPKFHQRPEVKEMIEILIDKADQDFRFQPESIYMAFKGQDFAQKKIPSTILSCFVYRILYRFGLLKPFETK